MRARPRSGSRARTCRERGEEQVLGTAEAVRGRMVPRLSFVGSSPATQATIEDSFRREAHLLDAHLAARPYLFGAQPAFADFGAFAQLYECASDPTPGAWLRAETPRVSAWIVRMLAPKREGPFEAWSALEPTLLPLLREEVAGCFLPWSDANARALAAGEPEFELLLGGAPFRQQTQKYHARSLAALRARYAAAPGRRSARPRAGARRLSALAARLRTAGPGANAPGPWVLARPCQRPWIAMVRGFASSRFGMRSVSTPSLKLACTFSPFGVLRQRERATEAAEDTLDVARVLLAARPARSASHRGS